MKKIFPFFVVAVVLYSCLLLVFLITHLPPRPIDTNSINTAAYNTALAMIIREMTMTAGVPTTTFTPTPAYSPTPIPTLTPSLTPSPFPAEIQSLLRDRCPMPGRDAFAAQIGSYNLIERYGDKGCILPTFSLDRKYLAYVNLDRPKDRDKYVDTVKVLITNSPISQTVYFVHEMDIVSNLEWSPTGQLIIWESVWEGPLFILIYDPRLKSIISTMRLNRDSELGWNSGKTALYAEHSHEYGAATCINELRGYDFAYGNPFPDFYELFNIEKQANDPLGIPNGRTDDLAIEPFAWSNDGTMLWITVTPLHLMKNGLYYEIGPRQAGVLALMKDEVTFTMLASDPKLDYSFEGSHVPLIVSSPYQPRHCP